MTMSLKVMAVCLWVLLVAFVASVRAEEQRCTDLGVNCVCSEPLNTSVLTYTSSYYNPADSTTRQCTVEGATGNAIVRNSNDLTATNAPGILGGLPPGHSVQFVLRGPEGHVGLWFGGHTHNSAQFTKRLAARYYVYHSPAFQFAGEGGCQNSKMMEFGSSGGFASLLDKSFGAVHMYTFLGWSVNLDCCISGPGSDNVTRADWRGKWWRVEAVMRNRAGGNPGYDLKVYLKNVTDNGPERLVVDLATPCPTCAAGGAPWPAPTNLTPTELQNKLHFQHYRQGTCGGFIATSHYMVAGWDTDSGQRIGPALEIEGGGAPTPPGAPTNLQAQ